MAKEKCFIIAPITTAPERAAVYLNDVGHCEHVIDHLLAPAVEKAGFEPIKPKAKGANLIHADIVANLQTASLILCDMSGLNPNVFFELGIRTAMNKPICLAIDDATSDPPFDLESINHHKYVSDLRPWVLPGEINKLAAHIEESARAKENALWKYFSLRLLAEPKPQQSPGRQDKTDLLLSEVAALRRQVTVLARIAHDSVLSPQDVAVHPWERKAKANPIIQATQQLGVEVWKYEITDEEVRLWIPPPGVSKNVLTYLSTLATNLGFRLTVQVSPPRKEETPS
jgi:hypothetical protein